MAIYHLAVKSVSRTTGRSAPGAAAYRSGTRLECERDGTTHDYTRRGGVEAAFIVVPPEADWALDRGVLWNAAEAAEKRKDAKTAREYEVAFPHELDAAARHDLAAGFAKEVVARFGVAADVAIHSPHRDSDDRNFHAHILSTTRAVNADGLGAKTTELDNPRTSGPLVESLRELWATQVNEALERVQAEARVDHRSYARQGDGRHAGQHLGPAATVLEREGVRTRIGDVGREAAAHNSSLDAPLANQRAMLDRQIERAQQREASERRLSTGRAALGINPGRPDEGSVRSTRLDVAAMQADPGLDRYEGAPSGSAAVTRGVLPTVVPGMASSRAPDPVSLPSPSPLVPAPRTEATLDAAALQALREIEARMADRTRAAAEADDAADRKAAREQAARTRLAAARAALPGPVPDGPQTRIPDQSTARPPTAVAPPTPEAQPDSRAVATERLQEMARRSNAAKGAVGPPEGLQGPPRAYGKPPGEVAGPGRGAGQGVAPGYTAEQAERILREGGVVRVNGTGVAAIFRADADELHGRGSTENRGGLFGLALHLDAAGVRPRWADAGLGGRGPATAYGIVDLARMLARLAREAADTWITRLRVATTQSNAREEQERAAAAIRRVAQERAAAPPGPQQTPRPERRPVLPDLPGTPTMAAGSQGSAQIGRPIGAEAATAMLRGDGVIQVNAKGEAWLVVRDGAPPTGKPGLHGIEEALRGIGSAWSRTESRPPGWQVLKTPFADLATAVGNLARPTADRWVERLTRATRESVANLVMFNRLAKGIAKPRDGPGIGD